ncbi:uncharacterized protein LOC133016132 [Limanda limanda]|uniref:uncharacterized protein LOC133016132 n=1 Tax=Limanda limanda TaxID=27771 RepID=UPI0029C81BE0|nr:uncharacterized protein LOC133016132 [Limanda limanda]
MGVPLIDHRLMEEIWSTQRRHLRCIQDPPGGALYAKTGEMNRGGVVLSVYRCARGSTSLESFHLHLCQFIPGTSANALHFQLYLLEGLVRWNEDRARAAVAGGAKFSTARCYDAQLLRSVNRLSQKYMGKTLVENFTQPGEYTGELIGVEYLYSQTGDSALQLYSVQTDTAGTSTLYGQVREIGALWQKLSDRDKAPISFPPRHQKQLTKGRFKSRGSATDTTPGVDSVTRSYLGQGGGAAQSPDASRLLEAVFVELCRIHHEGRTLAGVRVNRWGAIRMDYSRIRENLYNSRELLKAAQSNSWRSTSGPSAVK